MQKKHWNWEPQPHIIKKFIFIVYSYCAYFVSHSLSVSVLSSLFLSFSSSLYLLLIELSAISLTFMLHRATHHFRTHKEKIFIFLSYLREDSIEMLLLFCLNCKWLFLLVFALFKMLITFSLVLQNVQTIAALLYFIYRYSVVYSVSVGMFLSVNVN